MNLSEVYSKKHTPKVFPKLRGINSSLIDINMDVSIKQPEKAAIGTVTYNVDSGRAYVFNGSNWIQIGLVDPWQI